MLNNQGKSNKFKGLYMIAQRRQENSFNLEVPNNNPMNIKGKRILINLIIKYFIWWSKIELIGNVKGFSIENGIKQTFILK